MAINFLIWKREVEQHGLGAVQRILGYHDEPLHAKLQRIRSIRLGLGYRAYYRIEEQMAIVEEVNRHDYKAIERLLRR